MSEERRNSTGSRPSSFGGLGDEDSIFNTRQLETFGRKVTATASHLLGDPSAASTHYHTALGEIRRELRHPLLQRNIFALTQTAPRELLRSKLSTSEIQHRALTHVPDEMLQDVPEHSNAFSLFQGFQATLPEMDEDAKNRRRGRYSGRGRKLLENDIKGTPGLESLRNEKDGLDHRLEMMEVRKNMCSTEIRQIDNRIANLNTQRKIVLDRLADLEQEEQEIEKEIYDVDNRLDELEEELEDQAAMEAQRQRTPTKSSDTGADTPQTKDSPGMEASFMSESIYEKIPSPKSKRPKPGRRRHTNFILHEHLQSGSKLRELQAHNDVITALDFDVPFGTMVSASLDDTVRVFDLNTSRCIGLLEGHLSSVRCLQVEENLVATGSVDATVRVWDLSQADYTPKHDSKIIKQKYRSDVPEDEDDIDFIDASEDPPTPPPASMRDCPVYTLSAHVSEVTALHFHNGTLISGSSDKTLRQWDLTKGRCVQTLDVLWAAAQASTVSPPGTSSLGSSNTSWRQTGRQPDANADFVGAVQVFDAALACGTADGLIRLWDLRSGQVHRSLVGHTGAVTCLQFDDVHLVTGSADRSIRIWDLRTGTIHDAFAYDAPITSMSFDRRSIVAAAGENVVKVYDKAEGRQWDCGLVDLNPDKEDLEEPLSTPPPPRATVQGVRVKDGYMVEGRRDGMVGVWSV